MAGGGFPATYETVPMDECSDLLTTENHKLALSAPNAINFFVSCGADSWVGKNTELLNIQDSACTMGVDEVCTLDLAVSNQPSCPGSLLGSKAKLTGDQVWDIRYPTGQKELAV